MKTKNLWLILLLVSGLSITACSPRAKYERMLKHELASGVRNDSLFMGLYLGMAEKDFYMQCWKLNKKGLVRQGNLNNSVLYQLKDELVFPSYMDFYPKFTDGKICEMPVRFLYQGWAPWNKNLSSDKLEERVLAYYEKQYGKGFIKVNHKLNGTAWIKVNGNRRITIFKEDEKYVWAQCTDMLVKKDWKNIDATPSKMQNDTSKSSVK